MKKIILFAILNIGLNTIIQAQLRVGLKLGVSSDNLVTNPINIQGASDFSDLRLALVNASYGVHAGIFKPALITRRCG